MTWGIKSLWPKNELDLLHVRVSSAECSVDQQCSEEEQTQKLQQKCQIMLSNLTELLCHK